MKVSAFINELEHIGYNDKTELFFDVFNENQGESCAADIEKFICCDVDPIPYINGINIEIRIHDTME